MVSLLSFRVEGRALGAPLKPGRAVDLVDLGAVASRLFAWRTGFRYQSQDVVGFGTGAFESGPVYFGACVSFLTSNGLFLCSTHDDRPLMTAYCNNSPFDSEAFLLLDEHGAASGKPAHYGDVAILRRVNGRTLHCVPGQAPAFRSTACGENEKFRIWF